MRKTIIMMAVLAMAVPLVLPLLNADAAGRNLEIVGTGAGMTILEALAKAFNHRHPGFMVTIAKSIGSGGGIKAVGNDEYILGRVARSIKDREKMYGLRELPIVKMPIVFFVNNSVTATGLTSAQICGIYAGAIRRWEELGGGRGKIRVIRREDGDSSLATLKETLTGFKEITLTARSKTVFTDQSNIAECARQKNAIAFGSWSDVKNEPGVRVIELDGRQPSSRQYPHIGILSLIYKENNYTGSVQKFVAFIMSATGKKIIADTGGVPIE